MEYELEPNINNKRVTTALLLAAGTGTRLSPLTDMVPKCIVKINGTSILERLVQSLSLHKFKRLIVVVGHQEECIRAFLGVRTAGMEITYITNPLYKTTNNIYSFWLAREAIKESFLLIESDLVFEAPLLKNMLQPDRIAVASLQPWMNGTTVEIDNRQQVKAFHCSGIECRGTRNYKTVNIYSLSWFSWQLVRKRLDLHISNNKVNNYYETVFAELVAEGHLTLAPIFFDANRWYEIDTLNDLHMAEQLFPQYNQGHIADQISRHFQPTPSAAMPIEIKSH